MNLKQAVELATAKLSTISDSAKLDARLLTCHACKTEQTQLISHPEQEITAEQEKIFESNLNRRCEGEPLAYITGKKEFWSLDFKVNEHVLIPRPETELLVELTLKEILNLKTPRILDLGTGSGAIAISLANERKDAKVLATDISPQALDIAKKNAKQHKTEIIFIQSIWYEKLAEKMFDVIICNPPYIAEDDLNLERYVYQHEPSKALISDKNGLQDLEIVIAGAKQHLGAAGYLAVEHGFQQADKVQKLFKQFEFSSIQTHKDLAGLERATTGHA